jgi:hypothetical protein
MAIEILAQAAARLLAGEAGSDREPRGGRWMVGAEAVEFAAPALPLETIWARLEPGATVGRLHKVRGELETAAGVRLARATLLLAG